jgi:hypothetical protein
LLFVLLQITSPACTEVETVVLDWLARMLKLPEKFLSHTKGGGAIQGTASEASLGNRSYKILKKK